jgi:hypothetical protein
MYVHPFFPWSDTKLSVLISTPAMHLELLCVECSKADLMFPTSQLWSSRWAGGKAAAHRPRPTPAETLIRRSCTGLP